MATSITIYSVSPPSVQIDQQINLYSESTKDGTIIYEIEATASASFGNGLKQISKSLVEKVDSTTTTLRGKPGLVSIYAYLKGEPKEKNSAVNLKKKSQL